MLMDEVDVEGEPIFHAIERTMKNDNNRALLLELNNMIWTVHQTKFLFFSHWQNK
jgi:hypothetical protein